MAQQIPCDICGQTTADFIITAIGNGDTLGVGIECVAAWAEQLTSAYDAARAAETPPGGPSDGMPVPTPPTAADRRRTDIGEAVPGPDVTDAEWEASGAPRGGRGRSEGQAEATEDQLPPPTSEVAADVDG